MRVIEREGPRDLSGSVLDGARAASGDWVVVMDADGSHPPEKLEALLRPLLEGRCDLTVGSRHAAGGSTEGW
ncbi:glycosyltransferase, partial [Klebsiella variicola]|uniref:glycosyltransferase n=1 Tax=Klebsiella variicola TaxID=244366 RepID=UPI002730B1BA